MRKFSITPYEKVPEKGAEAVRTERRPSVAEELVDVDGELKVFGPGPVTPRPAEPPPIPGHA